MVWLTVKPSLRAASCCKGRGGKRWSWCTLQSVLAHCFYREVGVLALLQEGFHFFMGFETLVKFAAFTLCCATILIDEGEDGVDAVVLVRLLNF